MSLLDLEQETIFPGPLFDEGGLIALMDLPHFPCVAFDSSGQSTIGLISKLRMGQYASRGQGLCTDCVQTSTVGGHLRLRAQRSGKRRTQRG